MKSLGCCERRQLEKISICHAIALGQREKYIDSNHYLMFVKYAKERV
jgi:hypothetical protein